MFTITRLVFLRSERMFVNFKHSFFLFQLIHHDKHSSDKKQKNSGVLCSQNN